MRVLVTGAAGFVGSHLAEALAGQGHDVTCLLRPGSKPRWLAGKPLAIADCGMDSSEAMAAVVERSEVIYHLAGVTKARNPQGYYDGNTTIAHNLADAILCHGQNIRAVIGISSQAAAGPHPGPGGLSEDAPPQPVSHYGFSKLEAENILLSLKDKVQVGIVRPPMVYGPRDHAFLPLYSGARFGFFPIPGSRRTMMSIIHVSDLVRGILQLGEALVAASIESGNTYFLSGQAVKWEAIGKAISQAVGQRQFQLTIPMFAIGAAAMFNGALAYLSLPTSHLLPDKYREARQPGWVCSDDRARRDFGYIPMVDLGEGMRSTIEWCRENKLM